MAGEREQFVANLEKRGEAEVRRRFIQGNYGANEPGNRTYSTVKVWLDSKEAGRKSEADLRAEQRAQESLKISRRANIIAIVAIIISILGAATAIIGTMIQK